MRQEPRRAFRVFRTNPVFAGGCVLMLALGIGAASVMFEGMPFGIAASDPLTVLLAAVFLSAVALVACWLPARSAARTDPLAPFRSTAE